MSVKGHLLPLADPSSEGRFAPKPVVGPASRQRLKSSGSPTGHSSISYSMTPSTCASSTCDTVNAEYRLETEDQLKFGRGS
jgi:hypothetical protein